VKLTREIRDHILREVSNSAFKAEFEAANEERRELALAAYRTVVSEETEKMARKLGPAFVLHRDTLRFQVQATDDQEGWAKSYRLEAYFKESSFPVPIQMHYGDFKLVGKPLHARTSKMKARLKSLEDARGELVTKVREMILSTASVEKLLKMWPEAKQFLPAGWDAQEPKLPAVRPEVLNSMLKKAGVELQAA
jgi:hypothetical protein